MEHSKLFLWKTNDDNTKTKVELVEKGSNFPLKYVACKKEFIEGKMFESCPIQNQGTINATNFSKFTKDDSSTSITDQAAFFVMIQGLAPVQSGGKRTRRRHCKNKSVRHVPKKKSGRRLLKKRSGRRQRTCRK